MGGKSCEISKKKQKQKQKTKINFHKKSTRDFSFLGNLALIGQAEHEVTLFLEKSRPFRFFFG